MKAHVCCLGLLLSLSGAALGQAVPASWVGNFGGAGGAKSPHPVGMEQVYPYPEIDKVTTEHLQPWAKVKQEKTDWDTEDTGALCKLDGLFRVYMISAFKLMATGNEVLLLQPNLEETSVRRIRIGAMHPKKLTPTWNGDSVAKWDGDTLVVDTIGFNDKSWLMTDRQPHTESLHLTERMRMVQNGEFMEIKTVVDDPKALTSSYSYTRYYQKTEKEMAESVCNENITPYLRLKQAAADKAAAAAKK